MSNLDAQKEEGIMEKLKAVIFEDRIYTLIQDAYLTTDDCNAPIYEAQAIDDHGNRCLVIWQAINPSDINWDKPLEVLGGHMGA